MAGDKAAASASILMRFKNSEFNKGLQETTKKWSDFSKTAASKSANLADFGNKLQNINTGCKALNSAFSALGSGIIKISGPIGTASAALGVVASTISTITKGIRSLVYGLKGAAAAIINFTRPAMEAEKLKKSWTAVGGTDADLKRLKEMANTTAGVDVSAAMSSASAFMRMGDSASDAIDKVKVLANANSFFGGSSDSLGRAVVQIEQLSSKTTGFSGDLNSIANALPDVKKRLTEAFGAETIEDIQNMGYTGKDVVDQIIASYSTLPQMQATTADTFDMLKSDINEIMVQLGNEFLPLINKVLDYVVVAVKLVQSRLDGIKRMFVDVGNGIKDFFVGIFQRISSFFDGLAKRFPRIAKWFSDLGDRISGFWKRLNKSSNDWLKKYGLDSDSIRSEWDKIRKERQTGNSAMRQFAGVTAPSGKNSDSDEQKAKKLNDSISKFYDSLVEVFRKNEEITKKKMEDWGRMTTGRNENFAGLVKLVQEDSERRTKAMTEWAVSMKQAWEQEKEKQDMQLQKQNSGYLEQIVQNTGAAAAALSYSQNYEIPVD